MCIRDSTYTKRTQRTLQRKNNHSCCTQTFNNQKRRWNSSCFRRQNHWKRHSRWIAELKLRIRKIVQITIWVKNFQEHKTYKSFMFLFFYTKKHSVFLIAYLIDILFLLWYYKVIKSEAVFNMDNHTPEQRHKNMKAIKSKDTKIEIILRKELWSRGLRYQKNSKKVFGLSLIHISEPTRPY